MLAGGMLALSAASAVQLGLPFLIPALQAEGHSLPAAAVLVACPAAGLLLTLVAWGAAADRWGERVVVLAGLAGAVPALALAASVRDPVAVGVLLAVAGASSGSVHAASGRLILGWFGPAERGRAMGLRQTAQPLGIALAAATGPALAATGTGRALFAGALACLAAAAVGALTVRDPRRPPAPPGGTAGSPYRSPVLWRLHAASAVLVVPQFTVATFALAYLVDVRGWSPGTGGRLLALAQVGGAAARVGAGWWSDRAGTRTRPMRRLALTGSAVLVALAATSAWGSAAVVGVLVAASVITVSANGLAFTAVAEHAGSAWAGRALGIQNTGQNLVAMLTPPVVAVVITAHGYPAGFAAVAALPLLAAALVPIAAQARGTA